MRFVAADTSVLQYLIFDKGGASHGGRFVRASYFQTQGGVGKADIPLRFVQRQETSAAAYDYHVCVPLLQIHLTSAYCAALARFHLN